MNLKTARGVAESALEKLEPYCDRIEIAGSIRRKKPEVKDIELIAIPKQQADTNLFGDPEKQQPVREFIRQVNRWQKIIGEPYGKYTRRLLPEGIELDLFMPDSFDYYRQLAIRTGSAEYSAKVIALGWRKIGWCGSNAGLRKVSDCTESKTTDGKSAWKCVNPYAELPPVWKSEQEFFAWIGVPYVPPEERNP